MKIVVVSACVAMLLGLLRIGLGISSDQWFTELHAEVDDLEHFDCNMFHEMQNRPRPWFVRLNVWLEERHV